MQASSWPEMCVNAICSAATGRISALKCVINISKPLFLVVFKVLQQVSIYFGCWGERCDAFSLRSSRNFTSTFNLREDGEEKNCSLKGWTVPLSYSGSHVCYDCGDPVLLLHRWETRVLTSHKERNQLHMNDRLLCEWLTHMSRY